MGERFHKLVFRLAAAAEDELAAELWILGTLGLQVLPGAGGEAEIHAWFRHPLPPGVQARIVDGWPLGPGALLRAETVDAADWLAQWRRQARPGPVGGTLWVDPGEPDARPADSGGGEVPPGRRLLRLPARQAFGTGSHESTRLCLELLERQRLLGLQVLDVGTGTGILAFAALVLGARRVVALEIDLVAAIAGTENRARNDLWPAIVAGDTRCLTARALFDLIVVNVLPEEIRAEIPSLVALLAPGGRVVLSGLLSSRRREFTAELAEAGLRGVGSRREGEWVALLLERGP